MNNAVLPATGFALPTLPRVEPAELSLAVRLLQRRAGIILGDHKMDMAMRTLGLRTRHLGMESVRDYLASLETNSNAPEWDQFISAFTINHTAFFREQHHFQILDDFVRSRKGPLAIWSCAASTGEEPYSIAMALLEARGQVADGLSVLATDIDVHVIERARQGIYTIDRVQPVPPQQLKRYFLRGSGHQAGMARVKPVLRDLVRFDVLNLAAPQWPLTQTFDAIFCRNTMIYFDKQTQTKILERFVPLLKPGGLLFAGHSENFTYLTKALRLRGQTVYSLA